MRVPPSAAPDVQEALREVWAAIDRLGNAGSLNIDLKGKRLINAGDAVDPTDYVTRRQSVDLAAAAHAIDDDLSLRTLTVRDLASFLGFVRLPRLTDGSTHHGIVYVDEAGHLAVNTDGAYAFDLNLALGHLELGYGMLIKWIAGLSTIGAPSNGVIALGDDAGTGFLRLVLGPTDTAGHPALVKNGAKFEMRVGGGGGALTDLLLAVLNATTVNATTVNATTVNGTVASGGNGVFTTVVVGTDPGGGDPLRVGGGIRANGGLRISDSKILKTDTSLTDGAGAGAGTLNNAPAAGDPTKWLQIDDNGTIRSVPSW